MSHVRNVSRSLALVASCLVLACASPEATPVAASIAAATSAPLSPAPQRVGVTRAQVTVDATGQAQVAIPLALPDAGNGLAPTLSLAYYSGAEAFGPLGYGWSLAPSSSIRRCPASMAVDGRDGGLGFDDRDRACLDGQRLVLVEGAAYFADGSSYRLEHDDQTLLRFARAGAADPGRFTAFKKGGEVLSFGADAASRHMHTPSGQAIEWKLAELRDRSDNVVRFGYEHDEGERDVRLASIAYGGNDAAGLAAYRRVELGWRDAANPVTTYMGGQALVRGRRLERIDLLADGALAHGYRLAYAKLASGAGERLTDVQDCFSDGSCYAPTHFEYTSDALVLDTDRKVGTTYRPADSDLRSQTLRRLVDVDNDGFDDVVTFNRAEIVIERGDGHGGFAAPVARTAGLPRTWSQRYNPAFFYDLDADGRVDLLTSVTRTLAGQVTSEQTGLYVLWGQGDGFAPAAQVSSELGAGTEAQRLYLTMADADRDGRPELFAFTDAGLRVLTLRARRFELAGTLPFFGLAQGWRFSSHPREVADVNGDGFPDVVGYGDRAVEVALGHGFGFDAPVAWTNEFTALGGAQSYGIENHMRLLADANGDGLPDLVGFHQAGVYVGLNTGRGFAPAELWLDDLGVVQGWTSASQLRTVTDVNGDGWLDFVGISPSRVRVVLGHGGRLGPVASAPAGRVVEVATSTQGFKQWQRALYQLDVADLDSDGMTDLVCFLPEGLWSLANRSRRLRLTAVEDGYGVRTEIGYRVGNSPEVYRRTRDLDYPLVTLPSMGLLVASLTERAGAAGAPRTLSYAYENGVVHRTGLGFLGFEAWTTRDLAAGTEHVVRYGLDVAAGQAGLPLADEIARAAGPGQARTLLSRTETTWESRVLPGSPAHRFTFPRRTVTSGFDEAGALLSTTTLDQSFDAAQNLTSATTTVSDAFGAQTVTTEQRYDAEDPARWLVGKVTAATVTSSRPGLPSVVRTTRLAYDDRGRLRSSVQDPGTPDEIRTENDYSSNPFGFIGTTTRRFTTAGAAGLPADHTVVSVVYDARGYLKRTTNAVGHHEDTVERDGLGRALAASDVNGLFTRSSYDVDGTPLVTTLPDGTHVQLVRTRCAADCPAGAVLRVVRRRDGFADDTVYQDGLGRTVRIETLLPGGGHIFQDREYAFDGQLARESTPYRAGTAPLWVTYHFDALRRVDRIDRPDGTSERIERAGATTTTVDANGHRRTSLVDARSLPRQVVDARGAVIRYEYDAANRLTAVVDPQGRRTELSYDLRGRRTRLVDPSVGTSTSAYNALDLVIETVDGAGQITRSSYDLAGRLREQRRHAGAPDESVATWEYDTAAHGIGQLAASTTTDVARRFGYDALGRSASTDVDLDGRTYHFAQSYDGSGRPATTTYPSGLAVSSVYDELGFLRGSRNAATGRAYFVVEDTYPWGAPHRVRLGNGLVSELDADPLDQRLTGARVLDGNGSALVDQSFAYDPAGNLTARAEARSGESESFGYDELDRLVRASRRGAPDVTVSYDALGNIVERSDVGHYSYGEACDGVTPGPFAVSSAGGRFYCYDALGRMRRGNGRALEYGASDQPSRITSDAGAEVELRYGPTGERVLELHRDAHGALTTVRTPVSGFEDLTGPGGHEQRHHLAGGVTIVTTDAGELERYEHLDVLGSVIAVSDAAGRIIERYRFDPWGKRTTTLASASADERFGFTGHLELGDVGLVHMGGRVYDPEIGRFVSPDPFVQDETDTQSLNRYSYVLNNPLSATDPSGFLSLRSIGKSIGKAFESLGRSITNPIGTLTGQVRRLNKWVGNPQNLRMVASIAVAVVAAYLAPYAAGQIASTWGSWAAGAAVAGAGGYASGYIASDGNLDYARRSALTSMAFFCIAQVYGPGKLTATQMVTKSIAHGVVGGVSSVTQGDSFESGFRASAIAEGVTEVLVVSAQAMRADVHADQVQAGEADGEVASETFPGERNLAGGHAGQDASLGGSQASETGRIGPISYAKRGGGLWDRMANYVTEHFSGPHDYLGKVAGGYGDGGVGFSAQPDLFRDCVAAANVVIATPFALSTMLSSTGGMALIISDRLRATSPRSRSARSGLGTLASVTGWSR